MSDLLALGPRGEALAWNFLRKQGYRLLEKNFRSRFGEMDGVAEKNGVLVFIEVKTRKNNHFGIPAEAIDWKKRRKMAQIAHSYLQKKSLENRDARFDVVSILWDGQGEPEFQLFENAFMLDEA